MMNLNLHSKLNLMCDPFNIVLSATLTTILVATLLAALP